MSNEEKRMITLASERILLDCGSVAVNTFRSAFPNATVTGCYFHLTQSIMRKVNEFCMKEDYEKNDSLRLVIRCSPALTMFTSSKVTDVFWYYLTTRQAT